MMKNIFITGATGFLGAYLVREVLKEPENSAILLIRGKEGRSTEKRGEELLKRIYKRNFREIKKRIKIVKGDIAQKNLGINKRERSSLIKKIDTIYHSAALCNFVDSLKLMRKMNVEGTRNLLDFAVECRKRGRLKDVNHISTAGVSGKRKGLFYEDMLDEGQGFNNPYEQSKFEAEKLVRYYRRKKGLPLTIFRPGVIIGDSTTGEVDNFQMFYQFLHILSLGLFRELPINKSVEYGLVPVDYVARAISCISSEGPDGKAYHLVNPDTISFDSFLDVATDYFGFKKPVLVSNRSFNYKKLSGFRRKILTYYLPYLIHQRVLFDTKNFDSAMDDKRFNWPRVDKKFLITIFRYCNKIGYIKRYKKL